VAVELDFVLLSVVVWVVGQGNGLMAVAPALAFASLGDRWLDGAEGERN